MATYALSNKPSKQDILDSAGEVRTNSETTFSSGHICVGLLAKTLHIIKDVDLPRTMIERDGWRVRGLGLGISAVRTP